MGNNTKKESNIKRADAQGASAYKLGNNRNQNQCLRQNESESGGQPVELPKWWTTGIRTNVCAKGQPGCMGILRKPCQRTDARMGICSLAWFDSVATAKTKDGMAMPSRLLFLVETTGIEPVTSCMSSKHSNQLSYASATTCIIPHLFLKSNSFLKKILKTIKIC